MAFHEYTVYGAVGEALGHFNRVSEHVSTDNPHEVKHGC